MARQLTADFYRVEIPRDNLNFEDIVASVNALPNDESRNLEGWSYPVRLQGAYDSRDFIEGNMMRIRMDDIPLKASLSGAVELFDLEEDEGFGEETAFLYHKPMKVLILQRNKYSVSAFTFALYYKNKANMNQYIILRKILREDVMQKLARMTIFRKFDVKLAGLENYEMFRDEGFGVEQIIDLTERFRAPSVEIGLSMGKKRGTLNINIVRQAIRNFLRIAGDRNRQVKKMKVVGQVDADSDKEPLDLLQARMIEKIDIETTEDRVVPYDARRVALREALGRREAELRRMFLRRRA